MGRVLPYQRIRVTRFQWVSNRHMTRYEAATPPPRGGQSGPLA